MRRRLAQQGFGADHGFRWRGGETSRLEGLSDTLELDAYERLATRAELDIAELQSRR